MKQLQNNGKSKATLLTIVLIATIISIVVNAATEQEVQQLINQTQTQINQMEAEGYQLSESKFTLYQAEQLAKQQRYDEAYENLNQIQLYLFLEQRTTNTLVKIKIYWKQIVIILVALSILIAFVWHKLSRKLLIAKIKNINQQEKAVIDQIHEAQQKAFEQQSISLAEYYDTMYRLEKTLSELSVKKINTAEKLKQHGHPEKIIKQELESVKEMIKEAQQNYYHKKNLSKKRYDLLMEQLTRRELELEKQIFMTKNIKR